MKTRRYALDKNKRKLYIGSLVRYENKIFLVEDIDYLSWTTRQYLTLVDQKNKNKILKFISPEETKVVR
jgi:hypothetical protein